MYRNPDPIRKATRVSALSLLATGALFFALVRVNRALTRVRVELPQATVEAVAEQPPPLVIATVAPPTVEPSPVREFVPELNETKPPMIPLAPVPDRLRDAAIDSTRWMFGGLDLTFDDWTVDELDRPPTALQRVAPVFPYEERRLGQDGWARVRFVVDENGVVRRVVVEAASAPAFGRAAADAIRAWRFSPGMKDERAVRTRMEQPFSFTLGR